MKKFLHKKWLSIPVIAVLVLALTAGGVFAAFNFTTLSVNVAVDEPLQVQYMLDYVVHDTQSPTGRTDSTGWQDMPAEGLDAYFSAGDAMTLYFRFNNRANSPLTVSTILGGNTGKFNYTLAAFPNGSIPASTGFDFGSNTVDDATAAEWASAGIPISVSGDAPPGTYLLTIEFARE